MSETIRYAWGVSSLGDFVVAASDVGIVTFEFLKRDIDAAGWMRERFPDAEVREDDAALAPAIAMLATLVDHPDQTSTLPLDMRGSDYERRVWELLREIPAGTTTHYGDLAAKMGTPRDARDVTAAIAANTIAILIPCHRVVKKDGSISGFRWGFARKRALLDRERRQEDFQLVS